LEHRQLFSKPFGTPDSKFGTGGFASITIPNANRSLTFGQVATDAEGDIYAAGSGGIARFTPAGVVDDSFGNAGLAPLPSGDSLVAEAVDPQGELDVLLTASSGTLLARYTSSGALDVSYGRGGIAQVTADSSFTPKALAVQADGKPTIAGTESTSEGGAEMRVLRLNADGSVDTAFGNGGAFSASLGTSTSSYTPIVDDVVAGIFALANGDILVGGGSAQSHAGGTEASGYFAAARITPSGQLDVTYGSGGIARDPTGSVDLSSGQPTCFDARSDGSVVFACNYLAAAANASGAFEYKVGEPTDGIGGGPLLGVAALGDGRAVLIGQTIFAAHYEDPLINALATDLTMVPLASNGTPGQTVTTYDASTDSSTLATASSSAETFAPTGASIFVAPSGRFLVGAVTAGGGGYSLEEVDEGSASASRTDAFADGTTNSIAVPGANFGGDDGTEFALDLAYFDSRTQSLMFAQRLNNGLWDSPIAVDKTKGAGEYLSLADDSNGNPAVAYYDAKTRSLRFASSSNGGISFKITTLDSGDNVGLYPSLVFNGTTPEIAYYDETAGTLKFATRNSKNRWVISTIDSAGNVGQYATAGVNTPYHRPRFTVAYLDSTRGEIKWAQLTADGTWAIKVAAKARKGVASLSMAYSDSGEPSIVYYDIARKELRETDYLNNSFTPTTIGADQGQYAVAVAGPTDDDFPNATAVFAYDPRDDSLLLYPDGDIPSESSTVLENGGRFVGLAVELNGRTAGDYATAELAYVDSSTGELEVGAIAFSSD
jgi:uncharacterized delta-60 repeat protein